jgi:glucose/mannose-6-phosphate isomerase
VVAVTSGGALDARARELDVARLALPPGMLMPRTAFGHLALAPLGALEAMGLGRDLRPDLEEAAAALGRIVQACGPRAPVASNPAKALARRVGDRTLVIWAADGIASVAAARWKAAWNENAKLPAFAAALPELDHNEVVGWSEGAGRPFFLVALRHDEEHPEVAARFGPSIEIAESSGMEFEEVWATGRSPLCRLLELVLRGDLVSTYVALARGVDPTPIDAIARLKRSLAEAPRT